MIEHGARFEPDGSVVQVYRAKVGNKAHPWRAERKVAELDEAGTAPTVRRSLSINTGIEESALWLEDGEWEYPNLKLHAPCGTPLVLEQMECPTCNG